MTAAEKTWVRVATLEDLREGEGRCVQAGPREVALFLWDGRVHALDNSCPHRGAALAEGTVEAGHVSCPWHGWRFELASGACSTIPGEQAGSLPARVVDGAVEVLVEGPQR